MKPTLKTFAALGCAVVALAACDNFRKEEPKFGTLKHNLLLVDGEGRRYGSIEMDPVSGGKLFDNQGQVIGTIVTPAVTSTVTTVSPVAPAY